MNQPTKASKGKYRPVLPAYLIAHIIDLAKAEKPAMSMESIELIGILAPFKAKIDNLAIAPVYTTAPDPKLEQFVSLGGTVADASRPKEEYWEQCYLKQVKYPSECNLKEIQAAEEHKYLKGLMTEAETEAFELGTALVQPQAD